MEVCLIVMYLECFENNESFPHSDEFGMLCIMKTKSKWDGFENNGSLPHCDVLKMLCIIKSRDQFNQCEKN